MATLKVLGLSGSLRGGSYNTATLRAAQSLAPEGMQIEIGDISGIPLYSEDAQAVGFPEAVQRLGEAIGEADALIIATPEYNYSIPGALKNAIDWLSRLPNQPFANKPLAIVGASMGGLGTARAQYHLRQVLVFLDVHVMNKPEVMIGAAHQKFDQNGQLTDAGTREFLGTALEALDQFARRINGSADQR